MQRREAAPSPTDTSRSNTVYYDALSTPVPSEQHEEEPDSTLASHVDAATKGKQRMINVDDLNPTTPEDSPRTQTPQPDSPLSGEKHSELSQPSTARPAPAHLDIEDGWLPAVDEPPRSPSPINTNDLPQRKHSVLRKKPPSISSLPSVSDDLRRKSSVRSTRSNNSKLSKQSDSQPRANPPPPHRRSSKRGSRSSVSTPTNYIPTQPLSRNSSRARVNERSNGGAVVVLDSSLNKKNQEKVKRARKKSVLVKKGRDRTTSRMSLTSPTNEQISRPSLSRPSQLTTALQELASLEKSQRDIEERVKVKRREVEWLARQESVDNGVLTSFGRDEKVKEKKKGLSRFFSVRGSVRH